MTLLERFDFLCKNGGSVQATRDTTDEIRRAIAMVVDGARDVKPVEALMKEMVGKYVIVRCRDAGVHAGELVAANGREATLKDSRRLWYWRPANKKKFLSGVAVAGLDKSSKVGTTLPLLHLTETCELILCTPSAEQSIRAIKDDDAE